MLAYVKEHATLPFIYPMFVFVAHTGARRSEMCRSQVEDLDFQAKKVRTVAAGGTAESGLSSPAVLYRHGYLGNSAAHPL